ncbi:hypothetical protein KBI33_04015 [Candidatus Shapirobacteria bacterium]|nr:hypothetical protein [Candidatus Shapirobacteria bacterium]
MIVEGIVPGERQAIKNKEIMEALGARVIILSHRGHLPNLDPIIDQTLLGICLPQNKGKAPEPKEDHLSPEERELLIKKGLEHVRIGTICDVDGVLAPPFFSPPYKIPKENLRVIRNIIRASGWLALWSSRFQTPEEEIAQKLPPLLKKYLKRKPPIAYFPFFDKNSPRWLPRLAPLEAKGKIILLPRKGIFPGNNSLKKMIETAEGIVAENTSLPDIVYFIGSSQKDRQIAQEYVKNRNNKKEEGPYLVYADTCYYLI